jgi:hypothetical protein
MVGVAGRSGVGSGGPRPGGGRPKGSVNSESIKLQERALASGYAPLDVLLGMMRWYYQKAERLLRTPTPPSRRFGFLGPSPPPGEPFFNRPGA